MTPEGQWATPSTWTMPDPASGRLLQEMAPHFNSTEGWRGHGLGMIQKYVGPNSRLHVWHPSLMRFREEESTHKHKSGLVGHILYGVLEHVEVDVVPDIAGRWREVVFVPVPGGGVNVQETPGRYRLNSHPSVLLRAGTFYSFPQRCYHRGGALQWPVVTLVHLGAFVEHPTALFPVGSGASNGHDTAPTTGEIEAILELARECGT